MIVELLVSVGIGQGFVKVGFLGVMHMRGMP